MKTVNVRQIQHHFKDVLLWIEEGEAVAITSRSRIVAKLIPPPQKKSYKAKMPNFEARLKKIFPESAFQKRSLAEHLREERDQS